MVKDTSGGMGIVFSPRTSVRVAIVARKTHSNRDTIAMVQPTVSQTDTHTPLLLPTILSAQLKTSLFF